MFIWLFDWSETLSAYDCGGYNVSDVPLVERQHKIVGYTLIALSVLLEVTNSALIWVLFHQCDSGSASGSDPDRTDRSQSRAG
jgi:hypothetical protein